MVLDVADRLDARTSLAPEPAPSMYFSLLERTAFVWPLRLGVGLGWIAVAVGLVGWLAMTRRIATTGGVRLVVATALWALIASAAVLGALVAAVWLVRSGRAEMHPWFAHPGGCSRS